MSNLTTLCNPLIKIDDRQWIKLVDLLTDNVLALNSRRLLKTEIMYNDSGHYPAIYFRLTTVLEDADDGDFKTETSGFVFGFNNDWEDDVYIHALTALGYWDDWLKDNNITSLFTYHEVGLRKLLAFLNTELKLWDDWKDLPVNELTSDQWRELVVMN